MIKLFVTASQATSLPKPRPELWSKSKAAGDMRARWDWVMTASKEGGERYATSREEALDWFGRFFARVASSDFLTGRNGAWPGCDLAWLMKAENFRKVVEGGYPNREAAAA